jgi:hypothetical protein
LHLPRRVWAYNITDKLRAQVQVVLYFAALHLLHSFGLEALFYALKPDCEWLLGHLTGALFPRPLAIHSTHACQQTHQASEGVLYV